MNALELTCLAALWGASFLFMRVAVPEFGPLPLMMLRVGIAAVLLLPALASAQARTQFRRAAAPLFFVGLLNSALPFSLFAFATLTIGAGLASVINATTPLWTAVVAAIWLRAALPMNRIVGLAMGLVGVALLVSDKFVAAAPAASDGAEPAATSSLALAIGAALLAAALYGVAVNYSSRRLAGVSPTLVAFGSQAFATLLLLPGALLTWPTHAIGWPIWLNVLALGAACTALAYLLFFRLVARAGPAYAASVTFLVPVFGTLWGHLFLLEAITPMMLAGAALILAGNAFAARKTATA